MSDKQKYKVIFIDVDGVLNDDYTESVVDGFCFVDDEKINNLADVVNATGAHLILSSDWRYAASDLMMEKLKEKLEEYHLYLEGETPEPERSDSPRYDEIQKWLDKHPEVDDFLVIDDRKDAAKPDWKFIRTHNYYGLDWAQTKLAIKELKEED